MDVQLEIINYLLNKYQPIAIYLSGSRARNRQRIDSDWDIHLVVPDDIIPLSEKFNGHSLDIKFLHLSKIKESLIESPYSPAVPFLILFRNDNYIDQIIDLEGRTTKRFLNGPEKWEGSILEENKNRMLRFLEAINGTSNEELICFRHICKFFDLSLIYWFRIRNQWPVPIYEAINRFKSEDVYFYKFLIDLIRSVTIKDKILASNMIFKALFKL